MTLGPPRCDQPHYGEHLGDTAYWAPYVEAVLDREGLARGRIEAPFVGTFPTFLVDRLVVKLFGDAFDGRASHAAEQAMHQLLANHPGIPVPGLVGAAELYPGEEESTWPYLVTQRLRGKPLRVVGDVRSQGRGWAAELGDAMAKLHRLSPPAPVASRNLIPELRSSAPERLARFGLPPVLVEQVPQYLAEAEAPAVLVHADVTADHVFLADGGLEGIIDWGDAIVADRYYEFVAVYLDAFSGSAELFEAFLEAYSLDRDEGFATQALQGVLEFQFDAISRIGELVDLSSIQTLDELAERLFAL